MCDFDGRCGVRLINCDRVLRSVDCTHLDAGFCRVSVRWLVKYTVGYTSAQFHLRSILADLEPETVGRQLTLLSEVEGAKRLFVILGDCTLDR